MLMIFMAGRVNNEPQMKTDPETGTPYMILEVSSLRRYRDPEGKPYLDRVKVKLYDRQAERYQRMGFPGCKIVIAGDYEVTPGPDGDTDDCILKARCVEYMTYRHPEKEDDPTKGKEAFEPGSGEG